MKILIIIAMVSTVYGEAPAPYPASGWRPNGQPFALPSRQPSEQYGAPPQYQNQQYNTLQFSTQQQQYSGHQQQYNSNQQQYSAPQQNQINNQYGAPVVNNQYGAPNVNNQYGAPTVNNQNGAPNNQNGGASVDPLRTQFVPKEEPARSFAGNNNNFNQARPDSNIPAPGKTYLSQVPQNNQQQQQQTQQQQFGKLTQFDASQNVELFNQQQQSAPSRDESDENVETRGTPDEEFSPERQYASPTTTKRPRKQPKRPERTTIRPTTTTEEPATDVDSDTDANPNVAISTAVAGASTTGHYYILQQDGKLQRVVYMTSPDPAGNKNAAVIANLMYETVVPIRGPIYQYVGNEVVRIN